MAFDGKKYTHPSYTLPVYYHPGATFQAHAVSNCLQNAYSAAQQSSRLVMQTVYPVSDKLSNRTLSEFTIKSDALVVVAQNHAHIPANITHLCASVIFVAASNTESSIQHELTIANASGSSLSVWDTRSTPAATSTPPGSRFDHGPTSSRPGFLPSYLRNPNLADMLPRQRLELSIEIEKDGAALITLDELCTVTLKARAYSTAASGATTGETYRPYFVSAWWEVRPE